ncbi:hypothetical protein SUDANB58_05675 [Streptomyces sp. enrichment culture]|uniref:AQJ64_40280 family protein n=1 Tax=Streptomyces sp. enrichment culture TaxID=1795815 RepID=UPI003F56D73F
MLSQGRSDEAKIGGRDVPSITYGDTTGQAPSVIDSVTGASTAAAYDADGAPTGESLPDGRTLARTCDTTGDQASATYADSAGTTVLSGFATYTVHGKQADRTRTDGGTLSTAYRHDTSGRLALATDDGTTTSRACAFDADDNRTSPAPTLTPRDRQRPVRRQGAHQHIGGFRLRRPAPYRLPSCLPAHLRHIRCSPGQSPGYGLRPLTRRRAGPFAPPPKPGGPCPRSQRVGSGRATLPGVGTPQKTSVIGSLPDTQERNSDTRQSGTERPGGTPDIRANGEWVDARERLLRPGEPVAAATFGIWPDDFHDRSVAGDPYWLVRPMVFHDLYIPNIPMTFQHRSEDDGHCHDCFVDSDGIVRYPPGGPGPDEDHVTHWAALPYLPGLSAHAADGPEAGAALRGAREAAGHRQPAVRHCHVDGCVTA